MILGCLADGTGFSAAEIGGFDMPQAMFWWNCLMEWRREVRDSNN